MEVQKKIVNQIIDSLRQTKEDIDLSFTSSIKELKEAKTVEDIMEIKKRILLDISYSFPLDSDSCYFCILYDMACGKCEYGKVHKMCERSYGSDYVKIKGQLSKLRGRLLSYYHPDETYPDPEEDGEWKLVSKNGSSWKKEVKNGSKEKYFKRNGGRN